MSDNTGYTEATELNKHHYARSAPGRAMPEGVMLRRCCSWPATSRGDAGWQPSEDGLISANILFTTAVKLEP